MFKINKDEQKRDLAKIRQRLDDTHIKMWDGVSLCGYPVLNFSSKPTCKKCQKIQSLQADTAEGRGVE